MGRPRKKRKYTRRKQHAGNGAMASMENVTRAKELTSKVKAQITSAPPEIAKIAVVDLIADLQWVAKMIETETPPAP